jgi:phosphoglycolate phosphatase-like HAD superfamily hydrolase
VICGDEVSEPKPAPEGLKLACHSLRVSVADTAYVGDTDVDLECARAAGAVAIHASWGASTTTAANFPLVAHHPSEVSNLLRHPSPATGKLRLE